MFTIIYILFYYSTVNFNQKLYRFLILESDLDTFHFNFNLFHFPPIHYKLKDHMTIETVKQYKLYMQVIVTIIKLAFKQLTLVHHIND